MSSFLRGFADELVKTADGGADKYRGVLQDARREVRKEDKSDASSGFSFRQGGGPVRRDYLTSTLLGAASAPLLAIAAKAIGRRLHNRDVMRAMRAAPERAKELSRELREGKLVGRARPDWPLSRRPEISHSDLLTDAARGAIAGSVLQAISDRFSGSGKGK